MGAGSNERGETGLLVLRAQEIERLLDTRALLDSLEKALAALSSGRADVPARVAATTPAGILAAMPGFVGGLGLAIKAISVFPGNHAAGLPSHQGLIVLFDEADGSPRAIMEAGSVTAARTAGASAVSVRALARKEARILAVLGSGVEAASHLRAVPGVRDFTEIRVAARDRERAALVASQAPAAFVASSFEEAVRGADVVCCCTDAREPILRSEWLADGAHVTSVGTGSELDDATIARGRVFVEWRGAATFQPPAGARELQGLDPATITELGEVLSGTRPGRTSREELTVYKSTGHAVEDVAAARLIYDAALAAGAGRRVAM